jgi:hypothetical protein
MRKCALCRVRASLISRSRTWSQGGTVLLAVRSSSEQLLKRKSALESSGEQPLKRKSALEMDDIFGTRCARWW